MYHCIEQIINVMNYTDKIIDIYKRQDGVINRTITSKYRTLIQEVRDYMVMGWTKDEAVNFVVNHEFAYLIESEEDKNRLLGWFNGSFKNAA